MWQLSASPFRWEKPCTCAVGLCQPTCASISVPALPSLTAMHELSHQFRIPISEPVTYICIYSFGQDDQNEVQDDFYGHMTPLALVLSMPNWNTYINLTNMRCTITFLSCDSIHIGTKWCQWHHQLHHWIPWIKTTEMRCNMTFLFFGKEMPLVPASAYCGTIRIINGTTLFV